MGAGASVQIDENTSAVLKTEAAKPLDASDVATTRGESAKAEVVRLRALIAEQAKSAAPAEEAAAPAGEAAAPGEEAAAPAEEAAAPAEEAAAPAEEAAAPVEESAA
eukprot:Stramenopile-MAST_4_protein_6619